MLKTHQPASSPVAGLALSATLAAAQPRDVVLEEVTMRGSVAAVDHFQRILTLRGELGNLVVVDVPVTIDRFDQVKVGDVVTLSYTDRVTLRPKPAGEPAVDRSSAPPSPRRRARCPAGPSPRSASPR